ncbi:MAG: amino acid permease, partial [Actinomycetota bacterium]|nr:amino acid permease [Actinomycetota bacterium]
ASLGGEAARPRRDIPRAIVATVLIIGVFYVVVSAIEIMGFGTSKAGLSNFANSPALLGTLGQEYVAKWFGDLIIAGTVVSAFGCSMASCVGASRLIFSFARDGLAPGHPVARLSTRYGTPAVAVGVVITVELVIEIILGAVVGTKPLNVFAWSGTIATFLIIVAYGMVTVGAAAFLFVAPRLRGEPMEARAVEVILPLAGVALLIYTLYRNVVPYPSGADAWLPVVAGIWLLIALVGVVVAPSFSRRLGRQLVTDEGLEVATP